MAFHKLLKVLDLIEAVFFLRFAAIFIHIYIHYICIYTYTSLIHNSL